MLADEGGISCSFNSTVYEDTLQYVPEMVSWAHKHIDIVNTMVFIVFRHIIPNMPFDWYAGGTKVEYDKTMYHSDTDRNIDLLSTDVLEKVRDRFPELHSGSISHSTVKPDSYKWLLTERIGTKDKIYGYLGPKFLELIMSVHHYFKGTYLSYASPSLTSKGRATLLFLWPFEKSLRKILLNFLKNPFRIFRKAYLQTIMIIQPVDFTEKGEQNMCDGCPDITVYKDELIWFCRMEEQKEYDTWLRTVPKN